MADFKTLIDTAAGRIPASFVIKNCKVVNIFTHKIIDGDIAFCGDMIAGVGEYSGEVELDAKGAYVSPSFIDSHIHIESSFLCPEELGKLLVPHGTSCIIADPHEIVNVCGIDGLDYMIRAAKNTALDIKFMLPSCVPATPFEHSGAVIDAAAMEEPILRDEILGLGEYMNFPGVIEAQRPDLAKIELAHKCGKLIDGHAPGISGKELNAYSCAGIFGEHECTTAEELEQRISRGMYGLLREGSACHDLHQLLKCVTPQNLSRCLLCSDDRQPKTIFNEGHIDSHLRICIEEGIDALSAMQMATLNPATAFNLKNYGAIAPGYHANIVLLDNLENFNAQKVWIEGKLVAEDGEYIPRVMHEDITPVRNKMNVKDFTKDKLKIHLHSNKANVIEIQPGEIVTKKGTATVLLDDEDMFVRNPAQDVVKLTVVERHNGTGNVSCALLGGYGLKCGAIATTIAHDSHNILVVGADDDEMCAAVNAIIEQEGGVVLVKDGEVIEQMPLPIAGLMTNRSGKWVEKKLEAIHEKAHTELGVNKDIEPVMTLCFMALPVIPEIKVTDKGLFDVTNFSFIPIEAQ